MIKLYLKIVLALVLVPISVVADEHSHNHQTQLIELLVYKTPTCGCCKKWISHIEAQGIVAFSKDYQNIDGIKEHLEIQPNHRSCHTAVTKNGFVFEGHVPAKFIKKFLNESHSTAIGLSVPAMPLGSPGMEVGDRFMPYNILIMYKDGSSEIYASLQTYQEQF